MEKELISIIKEWKNEAGLGPESIILIGAYPTAKHILKICTDKPGLMIGMKGNLINKYRRKLQEEIPGITHIEFVETNKQYIC